MAVGSVTARFDSAAFAAGTHHRSHDWLGAHPHADGGFQFAVWAPRAKRVRVVGEVSPRSLRRAADGIWRGRIASAEAGQTYHLQIESARGRILDKADPFGRNFVDPSKVEAVLERSQFRWRDGAWMHRRREWQGPQQPMSVYEVHAGSWQRSSTGGHLSYRELGRRLAHYATEQGFTHIELLPLVEHPFYGSWGYHGTGYFAPTCRYGSPDDLMSLVDTLHHAGVGVILDWVPSHFATDSHGLVRFDGSPLYEHRDPRRGFHPDWHSPIFDLERGEVRSFLLSSAHYWLDRFHIDGLRVDAVASMLYLDFSRKPGEWVPNRYGGNENVEAYQFLRSVNDMVHSEFPGVVTIAEESSAWPGVTRPTHMGGIGFDLKWDMGWMHDTLDHLERDPDTRRDHPDEITFRMMYAHLEQFTLPLSHDEVVHEKGSLLGKMPGPDPERLANLRLMYGYQWALPGKKLLFMGGELAQWKEWDHDDELEWDLLRWKPHRGVQRWVRDLNHLLQAEPALHRLDFDPKGFDWIDTDDARRGLISFIRHSDGDGRPIVFVANLSRKRRRRYRLGVPVSGRWQTLLNSDLARYGGGDRRPGRLSTQPGAAHPHHGSLAIDVPPLSALFLAPVAKS
ncbi:MAG: 1,4-alpha-glucan branching protein GlgB [Acidobacteria bacterium]|nr:1,4-alpha-glucan branching protein GlgB [Acidobacteriota bacterium]